MKDYVDSAVKKMQLSDPTEEQVKRGEGWLEKMYR